VRGLKGSILKGIFTGERPFPLWLQLFLIVPAVTTTVELHDRRGVAVAAVGALVWGTLLVSIVRGVAHASAWSRAHPTADSALVVPLTFVGLAYLTRLGLGWCALIGVALWLVVLVLGRWRRRVVYRGRAGIG
jgi:microcompartment protein CcmK/EutM